VIVVDDKDRPGGRLRTDSVGGFLLDHGFQAMSTAYPNAKRELNFDALNFGKFRRGAYIYHNGGMHLLEPQTLMEMIRTKFELVRDKTIPIQDKKLLGKLSGSVGEMSQRQAFATRPEPTIDFLYEFGFGDEIIDRFFRPFLGGIFLDRSLEVDSRQFKFIWGMLNQGETVLPEGGMQAITDQIAAEIPRYLFRLGNPVQSILKDDHGNACGVRLDTTEEIRASAVVLATDGWSAAELAGQPTVEAGKSCTCLYFETATPIVDAPYLSLNGTESGIVNHVAPVSLAAPSYAPSGKHLAAATILGNPSQSDAELAELVKEELNHWAPKKGTYMWRFIRAYRIKNAQMRQEVGFAERLPNNATHTNGLYWAGEFTENSTIDGAIRSGMECAALVQSERGASEAA
jgi:phytoene dehydrogenase-like protein